MAKGTIIKKTGLGKGLNALLNNDEPLSKREKNEDFFSQNMNLIPIEQIRVNPYQPRKEFGENALLELSQSIEKQGIIQPITIRKLNNSEYQLVAGERRLQASKLANLDKIPAYVRTANDQQMMEMGLVENIQREDLNALEIAIAYQRLLIECNLKQEDLGKRVGKNRTTVNNYLRLLKLPPDIQAALKEDKLSMGHARALINIKDIDRQLFVFKDILKNDLSVRKVEQLVKEIHNKIPSSFSIAPKTKNPELNALERKLSSHYGSKIYIKSNGKKGEIKIPFNSSDDFNRILDLLINN